MKRILHAAAVYGVVGFGFRPIENVEQCITNALAYIDFGENKKLTSFLFPLLGTGTARSDLIPNTRKQVQAAVSYLRSRAAFTQIERVYFLGRTKVERSALRVVFAELQINEPWIEQAPVPRAKTTTATVKSPRETKVHRKSNSPPPAPPLIAASKHYARQREQHSGVFRPERAMRIASWTWDGLRAKPTIH